MIEKYTEKMQKSVDNLEKEYNSIRAGRANPHVLDKIKVDYYGTPTPLQQVGNISVPEPRILCIQPWETSLWTQNTGTLFVTVFSYVLC